MNGAPAGHGNPDSSRHWRTTGHVNQLVFETTAFLEAANARSLLTGSAEPYTAAKRALVRIFGDW